MMVAERLGYTYIDTGAMYRAAALYFHEHYVSLDNPHEVHKAIEQIQIQFHINSKTRRSETFLNGLNVENDIRKMHISEMVSEISAIPELRKHLVEQQRKMGKKKGVVMDGRDIGTVVFPEAELKIFMVADLYTRAHRRQLELLEKNQIVGIDEIIENLKKRDLLDTTRAESPLRKAQDAYQLDSTYITIEEQVDFILHLAMAKIMERTENVNTHERSN